MKVGVFDSGIGGLTVFRALDAALPTHDLLYLGDTARVPYGTRSPKTVVLYAQRVASFLVAQGAEALVIACNTATAHALETLQEAGLKAGIPVFGVIGPGVSAAVAVHQGGGIAVLGTPGTIKGGAYQRALASRLPSAQISGVACPLFVPLAEEGWLDGPVPTLVAERYLSHLRGSVDTAILGCTHYPLLRGVIQSVLPGVHLVDSASATAEVVGSALSGMPSGQGSRRYMVTDHPAQFESSGAMFLGKQPQRCKWVDLPPASPPFDSP